MEVVWILLGLLGWAVAILLVLVLTQMAGDQELAARRLERRVNHDSGTPDTDPGSHKKTGDRQRSSTDKRDPG